MKKTLNLIIKILLVITVFVSLYISCYGNYMSRQKINSLNNSLNDYKEKISLLEEDFNKLKEVVEKETNWTLPKVAVGVCSSNKSFKSYMDYRMITNKASKQYDLVHKKLIKSDDGLLRDEDGYIAVALGSHYGNIGDRFIIKFRNGKSVNVIKADEKDDKDTVKGCYHKSDGSIIEVIVDTKKINNFYPEARIMGDFNYSDLFNGEIKEVYKVIDDEKD